jgi:hypothetical protein
MCFIHPHSFWELGCCASVRKPHAAGRLEKSDGLVSTSLASLARKYVILYTFLIKHHHAWLKL